MRLSEQGIEFLEWWEDFRPTMYLDIAGLPTIGFGHLIGPGEQHLLTATLTRAQARELLRRDCAFFEDAVNSLVTVPLNQNQFDALVSFAFNVGPDIDADTIPEGLGDSTLLKLINSRADNSNIATEWAKWNKYRNPQTGLKEPSNGLTKRRNAEIDLFLRSNYRDWKRNLAEGAQLLTVVAFLAIGTYVLVKTAQA